MVSKSEVRDLDYYLSLRYPVRVIQYEDGTYFAEIPDLPGCMTEADTIDEVFEMIEDAKRGWIEVGLERGLEIPLPETEKEFSGKFIVRVPKSLHAYLSRKSSEEGVSLNHYVSLLLATNPFQVDFKKRRKVYPVGANSDKAFVAREKPGE